MTRILIGRRRDASTMGLFLVLQSTGHDILGKIFHGLARLQAECVDITSFSVHLLSDTDTQKHVTRTQKPIGADFYMRSDKAL